MHTGEMTTRGTPEERGVVVLAPDSLEDPGALLVPDLDDDVPTVDDAEPDDAVVEHHAGTAA